MFELLFEVEPRELVELLAELFALEDGDESLLGFCDFSAGGNFVRIWRKDSLAVGLF